MKLVRISAGLICCLMLAQVTSELFAKDDKNRNMASLLFEKAASLWNIRQSDVGPFQLKGSVRFFEVMPNSTVEGSFLYMWTDEDHWRSELSIAGFKEVMVGGQREYYRLRNLDYMPLRVAQWSHVWSYTSFLELRATDQVKKVRKIKLKSGDEATCVERQRDDYGAEEVCFDAKLGVLRRITSYSEIYEYDDFRPFQGRIFPRLMRVTSYDKRVVEYVVEDITSEPNISPAMFESPAEAELWPYCPDHISAKFLKGPLPVYPPEARSQGIEGQVMVYALVGNDGKATKHKIVKSVMPAMDAAAIEAMRNWQYQPAMCGSTAIPEEGILIAIFRLRQ
jgi:TonB family protein